MLAPPFCPNLIPLPPVAFMVTLPLKVALRVYATSIYWLVVVNCVEPLNTSAVVPAMRIQLLSLFMRVRLLKVLPPAQVLSIPDVLFKIMLVENVVPVTVVKSTAFIRPLSTIALVKRAATVTVNVLVFKKSLPPVTVILAMVVFPANVGWLGGVGLVIFTVAPAPGIPTGVQFDEVVQLELVAPVQV